MKSFKNRILDAPRGGFVRAAVWCSLYIIFVLWVAWGDWKSLWWLLLLPLIADAFTTKYINWSWWRKYKPADKGERANPDAKPLLYTICSWVDAIVFALVAVYFINIYIFQNYQIPSSSLEKTLRVGDFLYVSKMGYGARVPQTPLSMPLVQHTFPNWLGGGKSYLDNPHWQYKRLAGWKSPQKGDIVVFNFPAGDTVVVGHENPDYYTLRYIAQTQGIGALRYYGISPQDMKHLTTRPVDRRENYVKRCVGTPGDSLKIIDNIIYIKSTDAADAQWEQEPTHPYAQLNYFVYTDGHVFSASYLTKLGISKDDRHLVQPGIYHFPLTVEMKEQLQKNPHVTHLEVESAAYAGAVYPIGHTQWTRDNYGPIYLPKKGDVIRITEENYHIYKRIADAYEFKTMHVGEDYTFDMDYYWMMGDNRHNSADSRYWGFVPEDHIVGQPIFVWLSIEKDRPWFSGHIRWNRIGMHAY